MLYIKGYAFIKRTCLLLSPLFLVTLASKELAFYSPVATLSPILGDEEGGKDSIINLVSHLNHELPEGVDDYGSLKIQRNNWFYDLWIEETNSLSTFSHNKDYKYRDAKDIISKEGKNENKFVLKKESFKDFEEKGDINVLVTFELITRDSDPIKVTNIIPLSDLTTSKSKDYTIVTTKIEGKEENKRIHSLKVAKDPAKQEITFELDKLSKALPPSGLKYLDTSQLIIDSFYILFNDNPPLNPDSYFSIIDSEMSVVGDSLYSKFKRVFLNKWKNKTKDSLVQEEPTYEININDDFWKSTCSDPYKVGGFIDTNLQQQQQQNENIKKDAQSRLENQKKSWKEFSPFKKEDIQRKGQYFWKDITNNGAYVPHDPSTTECKNFFGVESETKKKFKEYIDYEKPFENEPVIKFDKSLIPNSLVKEVKDISNKVNFPKEKIIQSSFRAWGNAYLTKEGENLKEAGKYSKQFELANISQHHFGIKIDKSVWTKYLTKGILEKGESKALNKSENVSTLLEIYYPLSFSFFDPIARHFKKQSLFLKVELDLTNLYLQSHYSKEVFRFDIGRENKVIGKDYQGFNPYRYQSKGKEYGLDGIISLISGLELDIEKNLNINLTAKVKGFVNTKNPSCDLRHRLYKINGSENGKALREDLKCTKDPEWKYRDHIHIPSYLIFSLDKEPEISSFYIDREAEISEKQNSKKGDGPKNLSELESKLDSREITTVIETDEGTNADVYFKDIAVYEKPKENDAFSLLDLNTWWSSNQQVYYWYPRRTKGKLTGIKLDNLKSISLQLDGSKNVYSSFFHSSHFNTLTTLCTSNKFQSQSQEGDKCADGNNYDQDQKDKNPSELDELWGSQKIDVDVEKLKESEEIAEEIKFRVSYNRAKRDPDENYKFEKIKEKLEGLFQNKKAENQEPKSSDIPDVSMLAFWYSIFLWKSNNELNYATQVRPIGLTTRAIDNSNAQYTPGAAGSAGFQISKFELHYSKSTQN